MSSSENMVPQETGKPARRIAIVGGGFTGMAAAYDLRRRGFNVDLYEQEPELGGLAGAFEILDGVRIEKFYHHWFTSDTSIIGLIEELGLGAKLRPLASRTGLYYANAQFRMSSPLDLLTFKPIPLLDRIRTGLMVLRARTIKDWLPLEDISARDWIRRSGGERAYSVIWEPLLKGKFGPEADHVSAVWFWNKLKLRGGSRGKKGAEELIYFDGGFWALIRALEESLRSLGVRIFLNTAVERIVSAEGRVRGVQIAGSLQEYDAVLATVPLPTFLSMCAELPEDYRQRARQIRFLGNVCLVLRLSRSLSDTYWLNVADPSFPFVGVIEHTNFDDPANFKGEHIAFLSKYLATSDQLYSAQDQEVFEYCVPFIRRIFPDFSPEWVRGYRVWRAAYSQPVITKHYSTLIPPFRTPLKGLWLCTMAQVYPEDRGTNYAVAYGRKVAAEIADDMP